MGLTDNGLAKILARILGIHPRSLKNHAKGRQTLAVADRHISWSVLNTILGGMQNRGCEPDTNADFAERFMRCWHGDSNGSRPNRGSYRELMWGVLAQFVKNPKAMCFWLREFSALKIVGDEFRKQWASSGHPDCLGCVIPHGIVYLQRNSLWGRRNGDLGEMTPARASVDAFLYFCLLFWWEHNRAVYGLSQKEYIDGAYDPLRPLLPVCHDGKLSTPVNLFFDVLRRQSGHETWTAFADALGGVGSYHRQLLRWRSGKTSIRRDKLSEVCNLVRRAHPSLPPDGECWMWYCTSLILNCLLKLPGVATSSSDSADSSPGDQEGAAAFLAERYNHWRSVLLSLPDEELDSHLLVDTPLPSLDSDASKREGAPEDGSRSD